MVEKTPFRLLQEIETDCRRRAAGLPQQEEAGEEWLALAVEIGDRPVLVPLDEVREVSPQPALTRVPGVQPWLVGVANIRGYLVPVSDLQGFLFGRALRESKNNRLLVFADGEHRMGVLVGRSLGLRHFDRRDRRPPADDRSPLAPLLTGQISAEGSDWPIISLERLPEMDRFMDVRG